MKTFDYVPPFRGRAIHVCDRDRPFESLSIDFEASERRKSAEYERLGIMIRYAQSRVCRQQETLLFARGQHRVRADTAQIVIRWRQA